MKKLLLALTCGLFATQTYAQMTLDITNSRTNPTGKDTLSSAKLTGLITVGPAVNGLWDFSAATYNPEIYYAEYMSNSGVGPATHSTRVYFGFQANLPSYQTDVLFKVDASGMNAYGEKIQRQAFKLPSPGPTDSIIVNAQTVTYSSAKKVMAYPATFNTTWTSDLTYNMAFQLNYFPVYNYAPAERRSHVRSTAKVNGWGNAKISTMTMQETTEMAVLLVQTADTVTDSFYLNGVPAPPAALTPLGLSQGQKSYVYQRNLYRAYELTPLVSITYTDASYSTVEDANVHRQRLIPASVKDLNLDDKVAVYPNPVSGKEVTIELTDAKHGSWTYQMANINGQKVATGNLDMQSGKAKISLANDLQKGIYFITLQLNGDMAAVKPLVVE